MFLTSIKEVLDSAFLKKQSSFLPQNCHSTRQGEHVEWNTNISEKCSLQGVF
jgi:hypothetical protein